VLSATAGNYDSADHYRWLWLKQVVLQLGFFGFSWLFKKRLK
jgi:hypothetical protein